MKDVYKKDVGLQRLRQLRLEATKEYRARKAQEQKERRKFLKERGLCIRCGKNDSLPDMLLCHDCRLFNNQSRSGYVNHSLKWIEKERKAGRLNG